MDMSDTHKPFIWRKKYEEQGIEIDEKKVEEEHRRRAEANRAELEKIKERQRIRELEYRQKQSDNELIQRQKEAEQFEHWEQQEDDFILRQRRQKSKIRIRDGRAKPIDLFAHYIDVFGAKIHESGHIKGYVQEEKIDLSESPVEFLNPCDWFNGLRLSDLEELKPGIIDYMGTDYEDNQQYWQDLLDITKNEASKLLAAKNHTSDINPAVTDDIRALLEGKSIEELDEMEAEMECMLRDDDPTIDECFYKSTLMRLKAHRAKMRLTSEHKRNLKRQKDKILDKNDSKEVKRLLPRTESSKQESSEIEMNTPSKSNLNGETKEQEPDRDKTDEVDRDKLEDDEKSTDKLEETRKRCIEEYKRNCYSPKMLTKDEVEPGAVFMNYQADYELLVSQRHKVSNASTLDEAKMATMTRDEREFMKAASKGMNAEEVTFSCEAPVRGPDSKNQTYIWADKYQPRKPRYFNRVHTGFEWNKYNQTHYDIDNPPPKVVQGYKFNIFYPDLIDKSKAPKFTITPCKDDKDFCIIRFSAGPPYEDIAFRIVNREWNNTHKSGYRCQFINNMLQLWFQFKRYKYRR